MIILRSAYSKLKFIGCEDNDLGNRSQKFLRLISNHADARRKAGCRTTINALVGDKLWVRGSIVGKLSTGRLCTDSLHVLQMGMPRISNVCHSHHLSDVDAALGTRQSISDATACVLLLFRAAASARGTRNGRASTIRNGNSSVVVCLKSWDLRLWSNLEQFVMSFG